MIPSGHSPSRKDNLGLLVGAQRERHKQTLPRTLEKEASPPDRSCQRVAMQRADRIKRGKARTAVELEKVSFGLAAFGETTCRLNVFRTFERPAGRPLLSLSQL